MDDRANPTYLTADEAKHDILKTLNWFEAHNEYQWPDFGAHFSFDQVMRLRRVLVTDTFTTLERTGHIKPDSTDVSQSAGEPVAASDCASEKQSPMTKQALNILEPSRRVRHTLPTSW